MTLTRSKTRQPASRYAAVILIVGFLRWMVPLRRELAVIWDPAVAINVPAVGRS